MEKEIITGTVGTSISMFGTVIQTNELLQTISLIITIIGAIITYIGLPLFTWYQNAKKDGKITKEEIKEGKEIIDKGIEKISKQSKKED